MLAKSNAKRFSLMNYLQVFFATLAFSGAWARAACTDHGHIVDDKCVCSSPLPVDATPGWVGDQCSIPVHRIFLNGQDVQATCGDGRVCNVVTPKEPVCFSTSIEDMASVSYHMSILLSSNSIDAVVTLRGLLTNFTAATDPATGTSKLMPQTYPTAAAAFSFSLRTSTHVPSTQLHLTRRQLGYGEYTGLYLCAESTGTTTIALRSATHSCPFTMGDKGELVLCSGRDTNDRCPHGVCSCPAPYAPPANRVMAPGLGFEDCSATLQPLQLAEPQTPAPLAPGAWAFFSVDVLTTGVYELQVAAAATAATTGALALFLRYQQLPGQAEGQHDLSSDPPAAGTGAPGSAWAHDLSVRMALRRTDEAFRPGTWYLGVYNKGNASVSYTLASNLYNCPNGCSGRGSCAADTATCTCDQPSSLPPDCAVSRYELVLGQTFTADTRDFSYDVLVLPGIKEHLRGAGARATLTASFNTSDSDPSGLPPWVRARPVVLVAPSAAASVTSEGTTPLWPDGPATRMALAARGEQYSMDVGPWMAADDGSLQLVVWNPLASPARKVGYSLTVALKGSCPADCSGHGTCNETTEQCVCQAPYSGADCSLDPAHTDCTPGSSHPVRRDGLDGTCWAPCRPDGSGYDDAACEELACDGPLHGHGQLRRKGTEVACVEDVCLAGNYTVTDSSGDFVCVHRCVCPEDGSACGLEADCLAGTVQCLRGLSLVAETQKCAPAACQEGNLRRSNEVDGGVAFSVCVCGKPGDPTSCAFSSPTQADNYKNGVVACLPGFERQGATSSTSLSDGSVIVTGGRCAQPHRKGVSSGMVFFYCLLSIFLAAGLVVGGKYGLLWYEQYRYGRSVFGQGYVSWPLFGNRGAAGGGADDW